VCRLRPQAPTLPLLQASTPTPCYDLSGLLSCAQRPRACLRLRSARWLTCSTAAYYLPYYLLLTTHHSSLTTHCLLLAAQVVDMLVAEMKSNAITALQCGDRLRGPQPAGSGLVVAW
jgi:hypothetical protein